MEKSRTGIVWLQIEKLCVRSQPKRPEDVPDHVHFAKKWRGGSDNKWLKDINRFVQGPLYPGHQHISGSWWRAVGNLGLEPDDMCPFFILGCIKLHCSEPPDSDGICRHVTTGDIQSIARKKLPQVREAHLIQNVLGSLLSALQPPTKRLSRN